MVGTQAVNDIVQVPITHAICRNAGEQGEATVASSGISFSRFQEINPADQSNGVVVSRQL